MDAIVMLAPVLLGAALATGLGTALLARDRGAPVTPEAAVRHAARTTQVALAGGAVVLGSVGVAALVSSLPLGGLLLAIVPAVVGLVHLALRLLGEVTWPGSTGGRIDRTRVAAPSDPRPRTPSSALLLGWLGALVATLVVLALVADGPRTIASTFMPSEPDLPDGSYSVGPFPGWGYGLPVLIACLALVAQARGLLTLVARRPQAPGTTSAQDGELRARAALWVTQVTQLLLALTTAGVLAIAGRTLLATSTGTGRTTAGVVCLAVAAVCVVVGAGLAVRALARAVRPPALVAQS